MSITQNAAFGSNSTKTFSMPFQDITKEIDFQRFYLTYNNNTYIKQDDIGYFSPDLAQHPPVKNRYYIPDNTGRRAAQIFISPSELPPIEKIYFTTDWSGNYLLFKLI